jgi:hypothetical protein
MVNVKRWNGRRLLSLTLAARNMVVVICCESEAPEWKLS